MKRFLTQKKLILFLAGLGLSLFYFFSLPEQLFHEPYSTVLEDRQGVLLGASIASDGQWRFPRNEYVNEKFEKAIIAFEDKRFWNHPGVDVVAFGRAFRENLRAKQIVSGGSTLTMQVIRMSRQNPSRTFFEKIIETVLATRLELRFSKKDILNLYIAHAPFGGNVVGLEAACWRYFGRSSRELSWGEAALLAVLPNNPSLIHLARNREKLREKRDHLLQKLFQLGVFDAISFDLAMAEPVPDKPQPLPRLAPHLLDRVMQEGYAQQIVRSSVDHGLQLRVAQALDDHYQRLSANQIFNGAVLVIDVKTGQTLAYAGNTNSGAEHHENVDIIRSRRSTGSILKPFLYAALLNEGVILPKTLMPDVPTLINGFAPKNFSKQYDGAVPADKALIRSLNVPLVHALREYRYEKFYNLLQHLGMTTLDKPADHYGLSLILGGAEGTLWDLTGMYASVARTLNNYFLTAGRSRYDRNDFHAPVFQAMDLGKVPTGETSSFLNAASLSITLETLKELYRPGEETGWQHFNSAKSIAWKTGTSFGSRDGWAIGVNPEYAVGVWIGNADGEGRPGLTGTETAAPLLFDIFSMLPGHPWFQKPLSELKNIPTCSRSGQRASTHCDKIDTIAVPEKALHTSVCKYHQLVHLSIDGRYRVHGNCAPVDQMQLVNWFVLPPIQEFYFKSKTLSYKTLPPYRSDCEDPSSVATMDMIYPKVNAKIYLPVQLDGSGGSTVFEATHRNSSAVLYWHLDGRFIGTTTRTHQFSLAPEKGKHLLTLVDDAGQTLERPFVVISAR